MTHFSQFIHTFVRKYINYTFQKNILSIFFYQKNQSNKPASFILSYFTTVFIQIKTKQPKNKTFYMHQDKIKINTALFIAKDDKE